MVALDVLPLYEAEARARQIIEGRKATRTDMQPQETFETLVPDDEKPNTVATTLVADLPQGFGGKPPRAPLSRDKAAKAVGASPRVVQQAKRVAEKAPDLAVKVRSGELPIDRADRIVRDREAAQRRQAEATSLSVEPLDPCNQLAATWGRGTPLWSRPRPTRGTTDSEPA